MLPKQGVAVFWGDLPGCHTLPGPTARLVLLPQREVGIPHPPWGGSSPPQALSALSAVLGCGIRAAAKTPPHPAAREPGRSSTLWTRSWSQRERAGQAPAPLTEPWHPSDPTGTGAGSVLAAELPGSSSSSDFKSSPSTQPCHGGGKATAWADSCKPTGTFGCGLPAWPGTAQHFWASLPTSHPFTVPTASPQRGPHSCAPSPLLPACSSAWWGSAPSSCFTPQKGIFPSTGGSLQTPLLTAQGSTAPSCSVGLFYLTPFCLYLPSPCNVKVQLGCPGVPTWLGGAEHTALGVQVLPRLGAIRISTTRATPALLRHGVNQFCTGTSSATSGTWQTGTIPVFRGASRLPQVRYFLPLIWK